MLSILATSTYRTKIKTHYGSMRHRELEAGYVPTRQLTPSERTWTVSDEAALAER